MSYIIYLLTFHTSISLNTFFSFSILSYSGRDSCQLSINSKSFHAFTEKIFIFFFNSWLFFNAFWYLNNIFFFFFRVTLEVKIINNAAGLNAILFWANLSRFLSKFLRKIRKKTFDFNGNIFRSPDEWKDRTMVPHRNRLSWIFMRISWPTRNLSSSGAHCRLDFSHS